jgi:hypothetical protein
MQHLPKFLKILIWETVENAPMLAGLLAAIRIQPNNLMLALIVLVIGTACGAILIHFTESKKYSNQPTLKETFVNFIVFTLLSIPFIFYFSSGNTWWSNWAIDIVLGVLAGYLLSFSESWGWNSKETVKVHALSMASAFVLFLSSVRYTSRFDTVIAIILVAIVFNFFISIIIVLFDYWPIKEPEQKTSGTST